MLAIRKQNDRGLFEVGKRDPVHTGRSTRPDPGKGNARSIGQFAGHPGHNHRSGLSFRQDEINTFPGAAASMRSRARPAAGNAEHPFDAAILHFRGDSLCKCRIGAHRQTLLKAAAQPTNSLGKSGS